MDWQFLGTAILVVLIAAGIGAYLYYYHAHEILPHLQTLWNQLAPFGQQVWNGWSILPSEIKTILIGGIPTLFMLFFAWTKTRAMNQLQTAQTQLQQQASQIVDYEHTTGALTSAITEKDQLLQQSQDVVSTITAKNTEIQTLRDTLTQKQDEIKRLQLTMDGLNNQIHALKPTIQQAIEDAKRVP